MYGKTYNLHSSPALAPAEALLVSLSLVFDGLHDDINFFILACFYQKLLKKRRPHGEREPTIAAKNFEDKIFEVNKKSSKIGVLKIFCLYSNLLMLHIWLHTRGQKMDREESVRLVSV